MKVPHEIVGRTQISSQPLGYVSDAGAVDASPIAQGLNSLSGAMVRRRNVLEAEGEKLKAREDKTQRFKSLTDFSNFETRMAAEITELKRDADPTGQGIAKQIDEYYKKEEEKFLGTLPSQELQEEFRYRSSEVRGRVLGEALDFQYKAGDAYYRKEIDSVYQRALTGLDPKVGGSADRLELERARVFEAIDASDLSEIEKEDLKYKTSIGLESVGYKQAYKINRAAGAMNLNASVGQVIDEAANRYGVPPETLRMIAWLESRGNPSAQNPNSSAGGLFQFIDKTAQAYGLRNKMDAAESADAGARLARDNIDGLKRALGREPTPGEVYLAHQQGLGGATALLSQPDRLASDVVGAEAVRLNGGAPGMTAGQFAQLWTKKAGDATPNLDGNPAFANVPYETRINLRADAEAEYQQDLLEQSKAQTALVASMQNDLLNGILDGTKGQTHIDAGVEEGWLGDYDARKKAQDLYEKVNADRIAAQSFASALGDPYAVWDPTSTDNKNNFNAWFGKTGQNALQQGDEGYIANVLLPVMSKLGDIPTDAMGMLEGMIRSNNQGQALFALDTLSRMQDLDPRAFDMRDNESIRADVDMFRQYRNVLPPDQLMEMLGGGRTQEERQRRTVLKAEAEANLAKESKGVSTLSEKVSAVVESYGWAGGFNAPSLIASPAFSRELDSDFQSFYVDYYSRTGDDALSTTLAQEAVKKLWDVTEVGGRKTLMKYPPEKVGYKPLGGDYSWITRQTAQEAFVGPNETFELISDEQTESEVRLWKAGKGPPASYMVNVKGEDGVYRLRMAQGGRPGATFETNLPYRIAFEPTPFDIAQETALKQRQVDVQRQRELMNVIQGGIQMGVGVPQELLDEAEELGNRVRGETPLERDVRETEERRLEQSREMGDVGGIREFMMEGDVPPDVIPGG